MKRIALGIATVLGLTLGVCPTAEHALAANPATFAVTVSMIQPPVLTVTRIFTPVTPGIGGPVSFAIVVTNAGTATVTDLSVTDTLPPQLVSGTASEPSGFPTPVVVGGASATRFAWSGSGLVFGPNQSLTFTVTGIVGPVCALTALSDTPYVTALTVSGGTTQFGPAAGAVVQPASPALGAVQNLAPASPVIGGPVQYQVVVSNAGAATLDALTVVDTIAAAIVGVTPTQPGAFGAPVVASVAGGTRYVWSVNSGLNFLPGTSLTFQLDGTVGQVCSAITVSNTGFVAARSTACGATVTTQSGPTVFAVNPSAVAISVFNGDNGPTWTTGTPVVYGVVVTNTGGTAITGLTVTDTLPPFIVNPVTSQPAAFGAPVVTGGASATRFAWSAAGLALASGQSFTFTITGAVGAVCVSTPVISNEASAVAVAPAVCASAYGTAITSPGGPILPPTPGVSVALAQAPAAPGTGAAVTYRIVAANTGTATITGLVVVDTISAVVTGQTPDQPAAFGPPVVSGSASGTRFVWSAGGLTLAPGQAFTFTVTGTIGIVPGPTGVGATAMVSAQTPCVATTASAPQSTGYVLAPGVVLAAAVATTPGPLSTGQPFNVWLTVQNTGVASATNVVPGILATGGTGAALLSATDYAPVVPVLAAGSSLVFTWTLTASTAGTGMHWTVSATAAEAGAAGVTSAPDLVILNRANLTVAAALAPAAQCLGVPFRVDVTVNNTGAVDANSVNWNAPFLLLGTGGASLTSGPNPALPATVPAGQTRVFSWTFTGSSAGSFTLTTTITGVDAVSGLATAARVLTTPVETVGATGYLTAAASVSTATASVGQWVKVMLTVTAGGAAVNGVTPGALLTAGSGTFPVAVAPASANLLAGQATTFTWTYSVAGAGAQAFSLSGTGTSALCASLAAFASDTTSFAAVAPAQLSGTLILTPAGPIVAGQALLATFVVTNNGTANALGVAPGALAVAGVPALTTGWSPGGAVTIAGGASRTFTCTVTTTGAGTLTATASAAGTDQNSGVAAATGSQSAAPVVVQGTAVVSAVLDVRAGTRQGGTVSATVWVTNTGGSAVSLVSTTSIIVSEVDPLNVLNPASAVAPASLVIPPDGVARAFYWTYGTPAGACGQATVSATVWAVEEITGRVLGPLYPTPPARLAYVNGEPALIVLSASPPKAEVGHTVRISATVWDNCLPTPNPVPGENVTIAIVGGDGAFTQDFPFTNGIGIVAGTLRVGNTAGLNVLSGRDTSVTWYVSGGVSVEGTLRGGTFDALTKNFIDPKRGERVQIRAEVPAACRLTVRIFNLAGEMVRQVGDIQVQPGLTVWTWDGRTEHGDPVGNGTYFIQIVAGKDVQVKRVIVLKR